MTLSQRLGTLVAAGTLALGSIVAVASPAYAAPSCSYSGINDGYYFSCSNNTSGGVWISITCTNVFTGGSHNVRYEHRPAGYPWSFGKSLICGSSLDIAGNPRWGAL
ncbi:hypothetical protein MCAG_01998 [Micromonospora sp. ATCC 39149]|uniref:Uncharacterized protein n=1 Tax=Micromonospora carbonacea TaxID=47853 RepID=A0A7D5Y8X1_9ACTN|nr:hypothetical protein [Micromonospora sp. ATCC 39149]EEP71671.1 hypothetical protein MCAG_01998 [Micromonospora sp. ATCC 39149]QLJ97920.1 hypothetical protein HZU44_24715 [Micromonospora carbonacea]